MNDISKLAISIFLAIIFLFAAIAALDLLVVGAWLNGYVPMGQGDHLLANVTVSGKQTDDSGAYYEVAYTPLVYKSALATIFSGN